MFQVKAKQRHCSDSKTFRIRSFLAANIIAAVISFGPIAQAANLYVSYIYTSTVNVFDPSGANLGTFGNTGGQYPEGLAFDSHGNLYVANGGTGIGTYSIHKFGPTGTDLGKFASWQIGEPFGLAIDSRDNVYVAFDNTGNIHEYGPTGADLGTFAGGTRDAHGLAFDGSGNLYVANGVGNSISKYSPTGALLGSFGGLSDADGLTFDNRGNLFVTDYLNNTIYRFDPNGVYLGVFASDGMNGPVGLAFDNSGNLYVANSAVDPSKSGSIHEFSAIGDDLGTFATTGVGTGPEFLAFPPDPVPEPSTLVLSAIALLGLLSSGIWRRSKNAVTRTADRG
jgi:DNA-binding beta-propeller fold protein YncE